MKRHSSKPRTAIILPVASALVFFLVSVPPGAAYSWPGKWLDCLDCHNEDASLDIDAASLWVAVDGVDISSAPTHQSAPGQSFELDFVFSNLRGIPGSVGEGVGALVVLPSGPRPGRGTGEYSPDYVFAGGPSWDPVWNDANGPGTYPGWWGSRTAAVPFPVDQPGVTGDGYTLEFSGTAWESAKAAATDDGGESDLDGVAALHGADLILVAPAEPGTYSIWVFGIGHRGSDDAKAYVGKEISLTVGDLSSAGEPRGMGCVLDAVFPNPFNPQTTIAFEVPRQVDVTLRVFDLSGRLVRNLIAGETRTQGRHEVVWNGRDDAGRQVASGTYFYRLEAGEFAETKRMVLVK